MKYIITERQSKQLRRVINEKSKENELDRFIKRRSELIDELIEKNIDEVEQDGTLFDDEFEFADNIINWVVQDMKVPDDIDENDIIDYIKDEHGDYIMSRFNSEDDEDDDNWDDDEWDDDEN
jgi:predicted metal-dependent hydrolase